MKNKKNILFICSMGQNRSPTASEIFSKEYNTRYLGLYNQFILNIEEELEWADEIFVFEEHHLNALQNYYSDIIKSKYVINLDIPDIYARNQPELITILKSRIPEFLKKKEKSDLIDE